MIYIRMKLVVDNEFSLSLFPSFTLSLLFESSFSPFGTHAIYYSSHTYHLYIIIIFLILMRFGKHGHHQHKLRLPFGDERRSCFSCIRSCISVSLLQTKRRGKSEWIDRRREFLKKHEEIKRVFLLFCLPSG